MPNYPPPPNMQQLGGYGNERMASGSQTMGPPYPRHMPVDRPLDQPLDDRPRSRSSKGHRERKEGFKRPSSRSGTARVPEGASTIFPLAHTPDNTYISVVKSDIYQVQMRLESVVRSSNRSAGGDRSARAGKRHSELEAMKTATQDVETVTSNIEDPVELKLKLLEHLCGAMLQLEISILRATDSHSSRAFEGVVSRPGSANSAAAPPSLSRLPSFLALADRLLEFHNKLDDNKASAGSGSDPLSSSSGMGIGTAVDDMVEDIEDQVQMLESDLAMPPLSSGHSIMEKQGSSVQALISRLRRVSSSIEAVRERGIRFLQQENKEAQKTSREMGEVLDKAKKDMTQQIQEAEFRASKAEKQVLELQQQLANGEGGSSSKRVKELESQVKEFQTAASAISSTKSKDIEALARELQSCQKRLAAETARKGQDAEAHLKAVQTVELKYKSDTQKLRQQLADTNAELHTLRTRLKREEAASVQCASSNSALHSELDRLKEVQAEEGKCHREEVRTLQDSRQSLEQQLALMEAPNGEQSLKDVNTTLQRQVRTLTEQMAKLTRSFSSLEYYYKDQLRDRETSNKQMQLELVSGKKEIQRLKEAAVEVEKVNQAHIATLNSSIQNLEGSNGKEIAIIRDVMINEMASMKAAYDVKINQLEQDKIINSMEASNQRKVIQEQLETTRKTDANIINALKVQIEGLKRGQA